MNLLPEMSPPGGMRSRSACLFLGLLSLLVTVHGAATKFIAISATTVPGYARPVDAEGKPRPERYVFTQGKYFAGDNGDASLVGTKFEAILKTLAPYLTRQNYFPTKDVASADIVIVVHWGTTSTYVNPQQQLTLDHLNEAGDRNRDDAGNGGKIDQEAMYQALSDQANALTSTATSISRNSALLGYQPELLQEQRNILANDQTIQAELNEERYFVILMAYDLQRMKKDHKSHVLWATRISVRSPGNNFTEAMPALVEAGAEVYGRQMDGLVRVKERTGEGRVTLGEMKVLGVVEKPKPAETNK
jgi:hypothetical protein